MGSRGIGKELIGRAEPCGPASHHGSRYGGLKASQKGRGVTAKPNDVDAWEKRTSHEGGGSCSHCGPRRKGRTCKIRSYG